MQLNKYLQCFGVNSRDVFKDEESMDLFDEVTDEKTLSEKCAGDTLAVKACTIILIKTVKSPRFVL